MVVPSMRFEDYVRKACENGMYSDAGLDIEAYVREVDWRVAARRGAVSNCSWATALAKYHVTEQLTQDKGLVAIYTDITRCEASRAGTPGGSACCRSGAG